MQNSDFSSRQAVFRYLLNKGESTKQELFSGIGISLPTIKVALESLEEEKYICRIGRLTNTGGRNAIKYGIDPSGHFAAGVYLSQHRIEAVCVNQMGEVISSCSENVELDVHDLAYLKKFSEMVKRVIKFSNMKYEDCLGVGIAIPSLIDADGEHIIHGMTADFTGITKKWLSRYIDHPTLLMHDSDAAGLAEIWKNNTDRNVIYLNINDSIGGSLFINGNRYHGNSSLAGEVGHMIVQHENARRCYCGKYGCLDTVCRCGALYEESGGSLEDFFAELNNGDQKAKSAWESYTGYLATAIHNIRMLADCDIIIGGRIGPYIESRLAELCDRVDELSIFADPALEYIKVSGAKADATAAGAATGILDNIVSSL